MAVAAQQMQASRCSAASAAGPVSMRLWPRQQGLPQHRARHAAVARVATDDSALHSSSGGSDERRRAQESLLRSAWTASSGSLPGAASSEMDSVDELSLIQGVGLQGLVAAGRAAAHAPAAGHTNRRRPKYQTVMLKVSGEALQGQQGFGVDPEVLQSVAAEVAEAWRYGVRIAIVVGGGNFFRGVSASKGLHMERATADTVGMIATCMNALCLQSALEAQGVETRVQTAIEMREVAEPYIRRRAMSHLKAGRVVIFAAGTGQPFFTTDTAAALRAAEVNAEVFLKATKVDGVYDSDPCKNPLARRYDRLSYRDVQLESLQVMDETAITLCKENAIPVIVFNIMERGNILKAALGEPIGTVVCNSPELLEPLGSAQ